MPYYIYTDGETVKTERQDLPDLLKHNQELVQNYLEVLDDLEDPSYVARGNGFCDAKYSEDFITNQIRKYQQRIKDVKLWIQKS